MKAAFGIVVSIAAVLLLAEGGLRAFNLFPPIFHVYDAEVGTSLVAGYRGRYDVQGESDVVISSAGLRDREHAIAKPAGTFRIAILGDSNAEALQVPLEKSFSSLLQRELVSCPAFRSTPVETINFGVGGYGTTEELLTLRYRAWKYDPDLVLLLVTTGNDPVDNMRPLSKKALAPESYRPPSRLAIWARQGVEFAAARSHVASLLFTTIQTIKASGDRQRSTQKDRTYAFSQGGTSEIGSKDEVYFPPRDDYWRSAWATTEALFTLMADEVRGKGSRLLLVTATNPQQVYPSAQERAEALRAIGAATLDYADRRISDFGAGRGIPVLNLAAGFVEYAQRHRTYLHGFKDRPGWGHWNEAGHALAAKLIAEKICALHHPLSR